MFKIPLNFVVPSKHAWPELKNGAFLEMTDSQRARRTLTGFDNWVMLPYQYFKARGMNVTHSAVAVPDAINVISGRALAIRECSPSAFMVVCRADSNHPAIANYVIAQNRVHLEFPRTSFLPHPPLPGLVPRSLDRSKIQVLAYKGLLINLDQQFRSETFLGRLAALGITLRLDSFNSNDSVLECPVEDFSDTDVIIAVRNLTVEDAKVKPANKLVNAWRAGIPAILGPEPGYQEVRRSELDYFEVQTADEAITCLQRLVSEPRLYERMAENGRNRAVEYTEELVYGLWPELFNGPIHDEYQRWRRQPWLLRAARFAYGVLNEKRERKLAAVNRTEGRRILEG